MSWPDRSAGNRYRVETPERIDLEYDVAGIGSRFVALLLDTLILVGLFVLVIVLGTFGLGLALSTVSRLARIGDPSIASALGYAIGILLWFLIFWGYFVFFDLAWHGQSPGKRVLGLRVVKRGGYPLGFVDSVIRNVVRLVDFLPAYYIVGVIVMFIDRYDRRLGDLAAGTLVVKERRDLKIDAVAGSPVGIATPDGTPVLNVDRLSARDRGVLREYFARQASLAAPVAASLAAQLAEAFARKLDHDLGDEAPEAFLKRLYASVG
ncbi:MAG: RDD family protein [Chloroflexota bacterium]